MKLEELVIKDIKKALDMVTTGVNKSSIIALIESEIKAYYVTKDWDYDEVENNIEHLIKVYNAMDIILTKLAKDLINDDVDCEEMVLKGIKKALETDVSNVGKILIIKDIILSYLKTINYKEGENNV